MRNVAGTLINKMVLAGSSKPTLSATIYHNSDRPEFSTSPYQNNPPSWNPTQYPQNYSWDSANTRFASVHNNLGNLYGMISTSTTATLLVSGAMDQWSQPGVYADASYYWVFYVDTNGDIIRDRYNKSWGGRTSEIVYSGTLASGTCHAIDSTRVACCYVNGGALKWIIRYYSSGWQVLSGAPDFGFPHLYIPSSSSGWPKTRSSSAIRAQIGSTWYWYLYVCDESTDGGHLYVARYTEGTGDWSNVDIAVHGDMSRMKLRNAFYYNSKFWVSIDHQWVLEDAMVSGKENYNLLCRSDDGLLFDISHRSLPRNAPIASNTIKFITGTGSYFYSCVNNVIYRTVLPTNTSVTDDQIISFNDSSGLESSSADITLANANEYFDDADILDIGDIMEVNYGYEGEEVRYNRYIVTGINTEYSNGTRALAVSLTQEGIMRLQTLKHPFYTELLSRSFTSDTMQEQGGFFVPSNAGITQNWIFVDMWGSESWYTGTIVPISIISDGGPAPYYASTAHTLGLGFQTSDIKQNQNLVEYPKVIVNPTTGAIQDVVISVYANSKTHAGGATNDTFQIRLLCEDENGTESVAGPGTLTSTYNRPPLSHVDTAAGSYPIVYTFPGGTHFIPGRKIKRVLIQATSSYATTFTVDGVKISGISATFSDGFGNTGWTLGSSQFELERPYLGRPYIMCAIEPYSAKELDAGCKFSAPNGGKRYTSMGLAFYVYDSRNYMVGRLRYRDNDTTYYSEIVICRDGIETILATGSTGTTISDTWIRVKVRNGIVTLYKKDSGATSWTQLATTTVYQLGVAPALDRDVMHVGVYANLDCAKLRINAFHHLENEEGEQTDGIAYLAGFDTDFSGFAASGTLAIKRSAYAYSSKQSSTTYGAYQGISTKEYETKGNGVEITAFNWGNSTSVWANNLLSASTGKVWNLSESTWQITEEGAVVFKSRHFGANISGNAIDRSTKVFVGGGFKGISVAANVPTLQSDDEVSTGFPYGEWAFNYTNSKVVAKELWATNGDPDTTVKDTISKIGKMAGATLTFNDYTTTSITIVANQTPSPWLHNTSQPNIAGIDITFTLPAMEDNQWIGIYSSNRNEIIALKREGANLMAVTLNKSTFATVESSYIDGQAGTHIIRIVSYKNVTSIYNNGFWEHTFFHYPEITTKADFATIASSGWSGNPAITNVTITELSKFRAGIFAELGNVSRSVISNAIGDRKIFMAPRSDGSVRVSVFNNGMNLHQTSPVSVSQNIVRKHRISRQFSPEMFSDLVIYAEDVFVGYNSYGESEVGLSVSSSNVGGIETDEIINYFHCMKVIAKGELEKHNVTLRPDLRLEPGDVITISYTLTGTGTVYNSPEILIDGISIESRANRMAITGRPYL